MKTKTKKIPFKKLTPRYQRVAIAKDAIAQIESAKYIAMRGRWCDWYSGEDVESEDGTKIELQKVLKHPSVECTVCGLGATFASAVRLGNDCKVPVGSDSIDPYQLYKKLGKYFNWEQLAAIELAFELGDGGMNSYHSGDASITKGIIDLSEDAGLERVIASYGELNQTQKKLFSKAIEFGYDYSFPDERLLAIMKNIVSNRGTFKP